MFFEEDLKKDCQSSTYSSTIGRCLLNICTSDQFSDVTFIFRQETCEKRLPGHKLLLALRSKVFEAMFYGPFADRSCEVEIKDIDVGTFKTMLRDIYTDNGIVYEENVFELLQAAHKYELEMLLGKCKDFLERNTKIDNACLIFSWACHLELTTLKEKTLNFIVENAEAIFKTDGFLGIEYNDMPLIFSRDDICAFEEDIISAALNWAASRCIQRTISVNGETLRQALGSIIYSLRIPLLSFNQFSNLVVKREILTADEELRLYKYFTMTKKCIKDLCGYEAKPRKRISLQIMMTDIAKKQITDNKPQHNGKNCLQNSPLSLQQFYRSSAYTQNQWNAKFHGDAKSQRLFFLSAQPFFINTMSLYVALSEGPLSSRQNEINIYCSVGTKNNIGVPANQTMLVNLNCNFKENIETEIYFLCNDSCVEEQKQSPGWKEINIGSNTAVFVRTEGNISVDHSMDLSASKLD